MFSTFKTYRRHQSIEHNIEWEGQRSEIISKEEVDELCILKGTILAEEEEEMAEMEMEEHEVDEEVEYPTQTEEHVVEIDPSTLQSPGPPEIKVNENDFA
jgi:hypothetical protein